jgi:hypothetical protein
MDRGSVVDRLVDAFVQKVNRSPRPRIREEDIPLRLRQGGAQYGLYYEWRIQRFDSVTWVVPLEDRLPAPLPPSFRSLISRYIFPSFEAPPLILLANTGQALYNEMHTAIFRDQILSQVLLQHQLVQFARPAGGDYDPVCFDLNRRDARGECPVVRVDHEAVLMNATPRITEEICPSFEGFVERFIRDEGLVPDV